MVLTGLLIQGREEAVPLKEISCRAFLQGSLVGFRSKLTYENSSSNPQEVLFRTPVDDSHAVVDLEAVIDERKIRAEIQEKKKAREMYEEAIASGRTAAFGEEKKGDIFSIVLGNLPPGKKAEIHLTMVGELGIEADGSVRFVLPTVLKPRYTPVGGTDPLEPATGRDEKPVKHAEGPLVYKFDLVITGAESIAEVTSPSHRIHTQTEGQVINVGIEEDTPKDIVILVRPKEPHKPLVIVEPGLSDGTNDFQKSAAIMVSFFPEFKGDSSCIQAACEFVFLVDRSGSMAGEYIRDAAQTLLLFLKSIPEGCFFNIVGFGSSYKKLFPESVPYNQKNLEKAVTHAEGLQADLGGTEIFDPLKNIFSLPQMKGLPRQVFVLTDGSVSNTESVIRLVASNSHNGRCFSFGIGSGASTALVKGIAQAGKGTAEFITHGERMQPKVIRSLKKAMQPAVTGTEIKFSLPDGCTLQVAPQSLPPIFIGESTIVYGILKQTMEDKVAPSTAASLCLSGDLLGAKIEHTLKIQIPASVPKDDHRVATIHHLAGKRLIKEMEVENGRKDDAIIKLSCDSNVISSLTAFIAIDEDQKTPVKGSMQIWDVEAPMDEMFAYVDSCVALTKPGMYCKSAPQPQFGNSKLKKKGKSAFSLFGRSKSKMVEKQLLSPPVQPNIQMESARFSDDSESDESAELSSRISPSTTPTIIDLQLASGAWKLTTELAVFIGKTVDIVKANCPVPCQGKLETIWATIIALSYLQVKESDLKDEWELVAAKAESWLAKQTLPKGCTIDSLRRSALKVVH